MDLVLQNDNEFRRCAISPLRYFGNGLLSADLGDGFAIKAQINWERMAVNGLWERIERMGERIERMGERIERIELLYQILRQLHLFAEVVCQRIGSGLTDLASL